MDYLRTVEAKGKRFAYRGQPITPLRRSCCVRAPRTRTRDTDERIISRADLRGRLLPVVPDRYRAVVATAAGAGLRWVRSPGCGPMRSTWPTLDLYTRRTNNGDRVLRALDDPPAPA
jgi:hypothetical protein